MTEEKWLTAADPLPMLAFLQNRGASDRKWRLFACACCRRIWDRFPDDSNRALVAAIEDHPDGKFKDPEIHDPAVASSACELECGHLRAYWVAKYLGRGFYKMSALASAAYVVCETMTLDDQEYRDLVMERFCWAFPSGRYLAVLPDPIPSSVQREATAQTALIRDVFGNPFQPVVFDPSWQTETVILLARQMYESRDFSAMPILGDALQDAGCANDDILSYCRGPGPHVRGCHIVDLVLERA